MTSIRGFYDPDGELTASGFVRSRIDILKLGGMAEFDVTFQIDTGSPSTFLLDEDFLAVINAIGGTDPCCSE